MFEEGTCGAIITSISFMATSFFGTKLIEKYQSVLGHTKNCWLQEVVPIFKNNTKFQTDNYKKLDRSTSTKT